MIREKERLKGAQRKGRQWTKGKNRRGEKITTVILLLCFIYFLPLTLHCQAAIFDRVVAFVDNQAITLSEFQEQYRNTLKVSPDITEDEVINTMVNRLLLLREAKNYRIEASSREEIIKEYIDLKVRAFISIGEGQLEDFYKKNSNQFSGREYEEVRGEIEKYLTEKELNERLKEMLKELRKNAYLKIQLKPE